MLTRFSDRRTCSVCRMMLITAAVIFSGSTMPSEISFSVLSRSRYGTCCPFLGRKVNLLREFHQRRSIHNTTERLTHDPRLDLKNLRVCPVANLTMIFNPTELAAGRRFAAVRDHCSEGSAHPPDDAHGRLGKKV